MWARDATVTPGCNLFTNLYSTHNPLISVLLQEPDTPREGYMSDDDDDGAGAPGKNPDDDEDPELKEKDETEGGLGNMFGAR